MADPAFQAIVEEMARAEKAGKPMAEVLQKAIAYLEAQPADYENGRRDQMLMQMKLLAANGPLIDSLMTSARSGDEQAGMKNLFTLYGRLMEAEPEDQRQARQEKAQSAIARAVAEQKKRKAAHKRQRLAQGLSEEAGTGAAEPEVIIHGMPLEEDLPAGIGKMTMRKAMEALEAAKARRQARLAVGATRFGGVPDLPPGQEWPSFQGKKIPFLGQLNLSEFPAEVHRVLPKDGHLFAFALISNEQEHWPPPVSVFLYRGPADRLVRAPAPEEGEIWEDWTGVGVYEVLPATMAPKGRNPKVRSYKKGDTLGWLFGEMDGAFGTPGEIADDRMQDGDDWMNLLALMSQGNMEWSDAGHLYLLIRRSDLQRLDFTKVLAACCSS